MYKGHRKRATQLAAVLLGFFGLIVLADRRLNGSAAGTLAPWPVVLPGPDSVYVARCAACHGADGTGPSAKSILPYVRYHTDKELAQRVVAVHTSGVEMSADEYRRLAAELRNMTGTNPSMATGGYVGARGGGGRGATRTEPQTHAKPVFTPVQARLKLADGRTLTGRLMAQTNTDATLLGSATTDPPFYTIPARGEPGSETWIGEALEHGCGTTWNTGSYDATLDLVYWGIGNPCPDLFGDERQGDNLYTSSVVALEAKTGKLKWHYQFTPHDIYDWDSAQPMLLIDEVLQGTPRKLLMHADKNGVLYVLDRTNGKLLRGSPFASVVNWHSGFDANGRPIVAQPDIRCPNEAVNWMDVAFSPITKLFYGNVTDACSLGGPPRAGIDPLMQNNRWFGTTDRMVASPETSQRLEQMRAQYPRGPFMRAIDLATGAKAWDYNMGPGRSTGVLATAGNIVFIGGKGGIVALEAKTGQELWYVDAEQTKCDGLCHSAAAMTYMVGGKQYIAMPGSGVLIVYALADAAVPLASR